MTVFIFPFPALAQPLAPCEGALVATEGQVFVRHGELFMHKGGGEDLQLQLPASSALSLRLVGHVASPKNNEVAVAITYISNEDETPAKGSLLRVYDAKTGEFLREAVSTRTIQHLAWLKRDGGILAVSFVEDPHQVGLFFDQMGARDNVAAGVEFYDPKSMKLLRKGIVARGWSDLDLAPSWQNKPLTDYSVLFDPSGKFLARVKGRKFRVYEISEDLRLLKGPEMETLPERYAPWLEWIFDRMRSPYERFQRYVSDRLKS